MKAYEKRIMTIDFVGHKIILNSGFAKKCSKIGSPEYRKLQEEIVKFPGYELVVRSIKRNASKENYKGLTYEYMEDYIRAFEDPNLVELTLAELQEMILISKCHSQAFRYPIIKRWFLEKYPEVKELGVVGVETVVRLPSCADRDTASLAAQGKITA